MADDSVPFFTRREASEIGHTGAIHSSVPGRTDHLPISVPANSYVMPADIVSGLPGAEGNSTAGHRILDTLFSQGPYGTAKRRSAGGQVAHHDLIPIVAAGGEYVVPPEHVEAIGGGDIKHGHEVLDKLVKDVRQKNIKTLQKLPGPVKQ